MATAFTLHLPRRLYTAILAHAAAELPNECCGLVAGRIERGVGQASRVFPLANAAASPVEFWSDPADMFAAVRAMRADGTEILAVYHSHPNSPPVPSRIDLARNYDPGVINLIISFQNDPPVAQAWWLREFDFQEASWEVIDG